MSMEKFNEFRLIFDLICIDCLHEKEFHCLLGELFNIEGDLILSKLDQINLSHRACKGSRNFKFIDFKKLFSAEQVRRIYVGILSVEKEKRSFLLKTFCPRTVKY